MSDFRALFAAVRRPFRKTLILAAICAAGVTVAAACLLGLSGWFLGGAAVAGVGGSVAVYAFNYLLPSAAIRALAIARTVLRYFERYLGHAAALRAVAGLRPKLFEHLTTREPSEVLSFSRGEASARLVQDVGLLEGSIVAESAPASAIGGMVAAVMLNAWLGRGAMAICLTGLMVALLAGWRLRRTPPALDLGAVKAAFFDILPFLPDIAAYNMREATLARFRHAEADLLDAQSGQTLNEGLARAVGLIVMALTLAVLVLSHQHADMPKLALGMLATIVGFESLGPWLRRLAQQPLFVAAEARVEALMAMPQPHPAMSDMSPRIGSFAPDRNTRLLIDGPSGCGKTRLAETLIGLRPGGNASPDLFALAPQDAPVLAGTLRDNLRLAGNVSEAEMSAALAIAQLTPRVARMTKGLDTWIGEGGITLSGGERKRLSLARALLRPAPILILDEPTEGLDAATEAAVIAALETYLATADRGLILISHRPAPRRLCRDTLRL